MTTKELLTANSDDQFYIPMEVTPETIKGFGIDSKDVVWAKIGNKKVRAIMVPATKEQYYAFMRPLWREAKQRSHQSLDEMKETSGYDAASDENVEENAIKKILIGELHKVLDELEEIDRTIMELYMANRSETEIGKVIGMSQKGVNKRKKGGTRR